MDNSEIANCNTKLLEEQKQELTDEIINGVNKDYIKVFNLEAGTGKTRTAEQAIAKGVIDTSHNFLMVRERNEDCQESANNINKLVGKVVALAYNNESISKEKRLSTQKRFPNIRVLIITHQKYLVLAINNTARKVFTKSRDTLIIDEFVSTAQKISLSLEDINTFKELFNFNMIIYEEYLKIIYKFEDYITQNPIKKNYCRFSIPCISKSFSALLRYIRCNMDNDMIKKRIQKSNTENVNLELLNKITSLNLLCMQVEKIKQFFLQLCIINNGVIYTTDSRCKMWLLNNNIMLDASAELQEAYSLDDSLYKIVGDEKVLDHSKWTLVNIKFNSTTSGKKRTINYYEEVNKIIAGYGKKTLVISSKGDLEHITSVPEEHKAYHYNLIGSNKWEDLENVVVIHTPNIDDIEYILKYLHYNKRNIDNEPGLSTKKLGRDGKIKYEFTDKRLETVRVKHIAEQIYQGIKRVNRKMKYDTKVVIIINNDEVMDLLKSQLKGCKAIIIEPDTFKIEPNKQDKYIETLKATSQAKQFTDLMLVLLNGKANICTELQYKNKKGVYAKKTIREKLGIKSANSFYLNVLSKTDVVSFCKYRNIDIDSKYIKLSS